MESHALFEKKMTQIYHKITSLKVVEPSDPEVVMLFDEFRKTCKKENDFDVTKLSSKFQNMKHKFVQLWAIYEGKLEKHYATVLVQSSKRPLDNLHIFPFTPTYLMRMSVEYKLIENNIARPPKRVAFLGSGPLPLSSIILARDHLTTAIIDNFDVDGYANEIAATLVAPHQELAARMNFYTKDVMNIQNDEMSQYDVVFLAALVGLNKQDKDSLINHLAKHMALGSILIVRSTVHGAKAFMYPVVLADDLQGFKVLSVWHPSPGTPGCSVLVASKI